MKKEITFEDVKIFMDNMVKIVKDEVGITDKDCIKCEECSNAIQSYCLNKIKTCPMKTSAIGFNYLYHCFDIVSVSDKYSFIVDLTYKQFNTSNYPIYVGRDIEYIEGPYKYLSPKNRKEMENVCYIPLTKENLADYLHSFIKSYKDKYNIDEDLVLSKTLKLLNVSFINFCDINDFEYSTNIDIGDNQK